MALSARVSRALQQALGDQAGEDMVNWAHDIERDRAELRDLSELQVQRFGALMDARFSEFHRVISADIARTREELQTAMATRSEMEAVRGEMAALRGETSALREEMRTGFAASDA